MSVVKPLAGLPAAFLLLGTVALDLAAQTPAAHAEPVPTGGISGTVLDQDGWRAVQGARVRLLDLDGMARTTDESGRFLFTDVPRGIHEIEIQHLAFGRGTYLINVLPGETVHVEVRLEANPIVLDSMVITATVERSRLGIVGFTERQRRGWGHFFEGEDAEAWRIRHVLSRVPGLRIQQGRSAFDLRVTFRRGVRVCTPEIYLDRVLQRWANGNVEDVVTGLEIEGIEIYRGTETPMEFQALQYPPCGAIVIWTRR
jgi:hypothetical protein